MHSIPACRVPQISDAKLHCSASVAPHLISHKSTAAKTIVTCTTRTEELHSRQPHGHLAQLPHRPHRPAMNNWIMLLGFVMLPRPQDFELAPVLVDCAPEGF
jgi:hypothetical protein